MDVVEEYTKDNELDIGDFTFILSKCSHIFSIKIKVKNKQQTPKL